MSGRARFHDTRQRHPCADRVPDERHVVCIVRQLADVLHKVGEPCKYVQNMVRVFYVRRTLVRQTVLDEGDRDPAAAQRTGQVLEFALVSGAPCAAR